MIRTSVLSFIVRVLVSLWSRTLRVSTVNSEVRERARGRAGNVIYAFWHGSMFLLLYANRGSGVVIPVSESSDGEIMAAVLERFGFRVVRGSSQRNGHRALLRMVSHARTGEAIGIGVDGPRGPLHRVKKGAVFLAARTGTPIIPVAVAARRCRVLKSTWEKLMLPAPFTRGVIVFGEPVTVQEASDEAIEAGRRSLENSLRSLHSRAQELAAGQESGGKQKRTCPPMISVRKQLSDSAPGSSAAPPSQ